MSDSLADASFDVEAQESLLEIAADPEGLPKEETNARQILPKYFWVIISTEYFKLKAANSTNSSLSTSASHASITSYDEILAQDSEVVAAPESSTDEDTLISAHPASDNYERTIENQRKNIIKIVKEKNLRNLRSSGGVRGVAEALNTDLENGISSPQENCQRKPSQLSQFLLIVIYSFLGACNNCTIFLLFCAAALSLGFGIKEEGLHMGWLNGGVLMVTILIIVTGTTVRNCWEEWSHKKLERSWLQSKGRKTQVRVIRGGDEHLLRERDLEVGDIVVLRKGDQIPADGLFISTGQTLELESGSIKSIIIDEKNPFLFYGSRVIGGCAHMLVTSMGVDTVWGEMMSQAIEASSGNECKFESYLHKLNTCVQTTALLLSILIIVAQFLHHIEGRLDEERSDRPDSMGEPTQVRTILDAIKGIITGSRGTARILTTLLSVSLVAIMEGIPFPISVAAIIWSSKTLAHKASEKDYLAGVKMARVTTIITDKFGGMAEYEKEINKFYVGEEFVSESSVVASQVLEALCDGIGTLFCLLSSGDRESKFKPLLLWGEAKLGMKRDLVEQSEMTCFGGNNPFNELCQVLVEKRGNGRYLHLQGSPQHILSLCSSYYDINGGIWEIDEEKRRKLEQDIDRCMLAEEAEVIAYACKRVGDFDEVPIEPNHLIFLAMITMKEIKMEETRAAVSTLKDAGIRTILASGDDIAVLETIGQNCGLPTHGSDDLVLPAEEFRAWSDEERREKVGKIRIMGNCLPSDKIFLIKCLRGKGHEVALVAQRIVDAPALKQANIGVTYGTWSSEVVRECCDMIIWDGNCFSLLVNIIKNGRCFLENIRKFIQLQLILAISSTLINFVAVVFWGDPPITAVRLFWLNLVVGLVGGLPLLTGPPTTRLMTMLFVESSAKLITKAMCRNIVIQVLYQIAMFVTLQQKGQAILGTRGDRVKSVIYNEFFLCQMFNKFIASEPQRKNIFSGLSDKNFWFWVALVLFILCQAAFALAEVHLSSIPGLNFELWVACLLIGLVSLLLDWAGKIVPDFFA